MSSSCSSSSSSSSSAWMSNFASESLSQMLDCPIDLTLLTTAVSCVPCMHKISEIRARELYGTMEGDACSKSGQRCVVCQRVVKAYFADHTMRDLVNRVDGLLKLITKFNSSSIVPKQKEEERKELPYPGKPARFFQMKGNPDDSTLMFKSSEYDTLFKQFRLYRPEEGLALSITFQEENSELPKYLASFGVFLDDYIFRVGCTIIDSHDQIKKIFAILCKHNEIPAKPLSQMRAIIEKGT